MRWQNPWAWLGLLTLVLPVLVHLFSKRQTRVEPFPTLRFIDVSRLLPTRRTQLTDLLLLILRLLVLATAVAALAQPLWRAHTASDAMATVVIVDSATAGDSTARVTGQASLEQALGELLSASTSQMRIDTDAPASALAGAVAWLATQVGQRQLVIASDFRGGALDSVDLAMVPRDVNVRLLPLDAVAAAPQRPAASSSVVWWAPTNATTAGVRSAVTGTVRALGASALVDSISPNAVRVIVVATSDADSLVTWLRGARPLADAWMGDVVVRLRADTTLVSASASADITDTVFASPFTVVARTAANAPVVVAAALGEAGAGSAARLLLYTRAPSEALATAALLLGASRALEPAMGVTSGYATPDTATLRRWERAPAAPATVAASVQSNDALTGPSDARWFWLAALVLLAIETVARRQTRADVPARTPLRRASSGHSDD